MMSTTPSPLTSVGIGGAVNASVTAPAGAQGSNALPFERQYCQPEADGYMKSARPSPSQSSAAALASGADTVVATAAVNAAPLAAPPVARRSVQETVPSAATLEYATSVSPSPLK